MTATEPDVMVARILDNGRRVLLLESVALRNAELALGGDFVRAVQLLAACTGRVIVAGVGKSGLGVPLALSDSEQEQDASADTDEDA